MDYEEIKIPGIFEGDEDPSPMTVWNMFERGIQFNNNLNYDTEIEANELMFNGQQWQGMPNTGLPQPVFNILKRCTGHIVAAVTSENIHVQASQLSIATDPRKKKEEDKQNGTSFLEPLQILNNTFDLITERINMVFKVREMARDAAVRGDGCIHAFWDDELDGLGGTHGDVNCEVLDATRVFFGDPNTPEVDLQPYILVTKRMSVRDVLLRMKANDCTENWRNVRPDMDRKKSNLTNLNYAPGLEDKTTLIRVYYKNEETGTIWCYECVDGATVLDPTDMEIKRYPIVWLNWNKSMDNYHGGSFVKGLLSTQTSINKMAAAMMLATLKSPTGKIAYDRTRISKPNNQVVGLLPVNGPVTGAIQNISPPEINPQVYQMFNNFIQASEESVGCTQAVLGTAPA